MPIIRKILHLGDSVAVTLPKSWLECFQRESELPITEVMLEVDKKLTIMPILPKKEEAVTNA